MISPTPERSSQVFTEDQDSDYPHISSEVAPMETPTVEGPAIAEGLWLMPFFLMAIAWIFMFLQRTTYWKLLQSRLRHPTQCQKIPCANCRFFNNNPHIQCAVHPCRVLKAGATDCPDYWPQDSNKFPMS